MKSTLVTRQLPLLAAIGALAFAALPASPVRAASVVWGTPTLISADTDVSTTGSLLYAFTFGSTDALGADLDGRSGSGSPEASSVPSATVNGVTFAPFAVPHRNATTVTVGSVSLAVDRETSFTPRTNSRETHCLPSRPSRLPTKGYCKAVSLPLISMQL